MLISEYQPLGSLGQESPPKPDSNTVEEDPILEPVVVTTPEGVEEIVYLPMYEVETPSGVRVSITAEEEADAIREAITQNLVSKMTRYSKIEDAVIGAVGNALGFAIGGFLVGLILKEKSRV